MNQQCPVVRCRKGFHPKLGSCNFRNGVNHILSNPDKLSKINSKNNFNEPRVRDKGVRHETKLQMDERRAAEKQLYHDVKEQGRANVRLAKLERLCDESVQTATLDPEESVLYQGRKSYDHFSLEGRKYKKYDSEGAKTPKSRGMRQFKVNMEEVNGEFRKHLNEVGHFNAWHERYSNISNDIASRHSVAENSRYIKYEIEEALREYRSSTQPSKPIKPISQKVVPQEQKLVCEYEVEVDMKYEEFVKEAYGAHEKGCYEEYCQNEKMQNAYEGEVRQYEEFMEAEYNHH